jgi:DNA-binding NtrC family response regulator
MDSGAFREDLYGRLAGYTLELPSLRDRLEDLGLVVARALTTIDADRAPRVRFTHETGRALFAHTWPRNMRQLHHALELALTVADGDEVRVDHLPAEITAPPAPPQPTTPAPAQPVGDQRAAIVAALRDHAGNVSAAARALGYSRSHLNRLLKQHRIEPASYRP